MTGSGLRWWYCTRCKWKCLRIKPPAKCYKGCYHARFRRAEE